MKVVVIGFRGQLGSDLMEVLGSDDYFKVEGLSHEDIEVSDLNSCRKALSREMVDAVINTAAFHKTDLCEDEPEKAFNVNAIGAYNVSLICREIDAINIYISTDYVFDGEAGRPYLENDVPNPINVYGASKLAGEVLTMAYSPKHYIIRTSSLFGRAGASGKGGNFVETIISRAKSGQTLKVVNDIIMSPTHTLDLAKAIASILKMNLPYGVYHIANSGHCSWYEFAKKIVELAKLDANVEPISNLDYPSRARRPRFSALRSMKLRNYNITMKDWADALKEYLMLKGHPIG